jgi:hypothetical protein
MLFVFIIALKMLLRQLDNKQINNW